jgi:hypothetical protein
MLLVAFRVALGLAVVVGLVRRRKASLSGRLVAFIMPAATVAVVALIAAAVLEGPYSPWDVVRLAPTAALARGLPLYAGRDGDGPILSTMYAPFSALAFLPATLARDPAVAILMGRLLSSTYYFFPIFLMSSGRARLPTFLLAALATFASPPLRYSATCIHSDAPALGMLGLACWAASRGRGREVTAPACVCGWLSVWSKQTMILLPLALWLWATSARGWRAGLKSGIWLLVTGALISSTFLLSFDRDALLFDAVSWPGHLPWKGSTPGNLFDALYELVPHTLPFAVVLMAGAGAAAEDDEARWRFPVLVALAMVPMAVLGRVKKGGDVNSFSPAIYPLLLAATALLSAILDGRKGRRDHVENDTDQTLTPALSQREREEESPPLPLGEGRGEGFPRDAHATWQRLLGAVLVALTALAVPMVDRELSIYRRLRPRNSEYCYLIAHPGEALFPWHPLAHLAAEGRPTHHLHSVRERGVAGFPVGCDWTLSHIPKKARFAAFPLKRLGPVAGFAWSFELLEEHGLIAPGARPFRVEELPDYECYELTTPATRRARRGESP